MRSLRFTLPIATLAVLLAACGDATSSSGQGSTTTPPACVTGTLTASGSSALQPLMDKAGKAYAAACSGATVTVGASNSTAGLTDVSNGASEIGDSDVPIGTVPALAGSSLVDHQVAIVIIGVIVNKDAGVTNLTTKNLQDIFSKNVTNWKQVGGADQPIAVVERKAGSGTRLSFDADIMGNSEETNAPASTAATTSAVLTTVPSVPGAISYTNIADVKSISGITVVSIDGTAAGADGVNSGGYALFAHEHCYTGSNPSPLVASFLAYVLSPAFQGTVTAAGYLPVGATTKQSAIDKL